MAVRNVPRVTRHIVMVVRRHDLKSLALWTEYEARGRTRSKIEVLKTVRAIFPSHKIGLQEKRSAYDVSEEGADDWLQAHGYEVLDRIDVVLDSPIKLF